MRFLEFAVISISHKQANEAIRSHVAFMDSQKIECYERLLELEVFQAVIVATCNRSELYFLYETEDQIDAVIQLYETMAQIEIRPYLMIKKRKDALIYLYEVCLGYHSLIIGEDQIESQIQAAYAFAVHMQACQKQMHRIFQNCFKTVKQIKTKYQISANPISLPYIAMCMIKKKMALKDKTVLLIGSGEVAKLFLTYCKEEDVKALYICSRQFKHAQMLQDDKRIHIVPFEERYHIVSQCDLVCSATSSPHQILCFAQYPKTHPKQLCIDLAMPCDIDKRISSLGVEVVGIDDLSLVKNEHVRQREQLLKMAHKELIDGVEEVVEWLDSQPLQEAISSLQRKSEESAQMAYEMILSKIDLDHHEQRIVQKILKASFFRMIKEPMLMLSKNKEHQQEYLNMITQLFQTEEKG